MNQRKLSNSTKELIARKVRRMFRLIRLIPSAIQQTDIRYSAGTSDAVTTQLPPQA